MTRSDTDMLSSSLYPPRQGMDVSYGRRWWSFEEDFEGLYVEGHDRRSVAAASDAIGHLYGPRKASDKSRIAITRQWMAWTSTCGHSVEDHAVHVEESRAAGLDWVDCDCPDPGLPPCGNRYAWAVLKLSLEPSPGAVPILVVE